MEPLSRNSQEMLRETVFQLVARSQHLDKLFKEISDECEHKSSGFRSMSDLCCVSLIKGQSLQFETSAQHYGGDQCASVLSTVVKSSQGPLLSDSQKWQGMDCINEKEPVCLGAHIVASLLIHYQFVCASKEEGIYPLKRRTTTESVLHTVRVLLSEGCFEKTRFVQLLLLHPSLPLQLVWIFSKEGILTSGTYISKKCSTARFLSDFSSQMKQLILETGRTDAASLCLAGILSELLEILFIDRKLKTFSSDDLTAIMSVVNRAVLDFVDVVLDKGGGECQTFTKAFEKLDISIETMKKAMLHLLSVVLSYKPVTKVSQAIQLQGGWCYSKASVLLTDWYKQLLLPLTTDEILEKLQRILEQQEVNWQLLLTFVSTMIVCFTDSQKTFLDFTDKLLQEGLENCDMEPMITGLLLIRQACYHGPHVFMSYSDWFQRTFSEGSRSLAGNRKSFSFLLKFLTDIMPYETASHLKVHTLRPPFVPPKCREQLADYVLLAKTRLEDLKESLEVQGQDDLKLADENKQQEKLQAEVENAVSLYSTSGKIPSSVMEASIFKKPHYIGRFLPALLKPRPLPSVPDAKMKLVEALKKAGKIPPSMYSSYEKACKKETAQLTEGLFLDLDSDDDMELSPLEQLESTLNQLHLTVQFLCGNNEESPKLNVREAVCNICEKIETALNIAPEQSEARQQCMVLDTDNLGIPQQSLQVVDILLNTISQTVYATYSSPNIDFSWLSPLLKGISQYSAILRNFVIRIWSLLIPQEQNLDNHHIDGLAAILVELQKQNHQLPSIQFSGRCAQCCQVVRTFTEHVYRMIPISDGRKMSFTLRLTASYMKYLISSQEESNIASSVLPVVIKKLMYTATRLLPEARYLTLNQGTDNDETDQFIVSLIKSTFFQDILQNFKLTFTDWLNYEIMIDTDNDLFTDVERYEYYSWAVYQHFLPMTVDQGGFDRDFRLAGSQVLQVIVSSDSKYQERQPACQKCASSSPVGSFSRNQFVSLLQELTRMFDDQSDSDYGAKLPWLPRQLFALHETATSSVQKQAVVTSFFRVALCLPAYLMFSDKNHSDEKLNSKELAKFFNTYLVEYLTEGVHLPLSVTLYIVQGLKLATTEESFCKSLDTLCGRCPVISISILVHHNQLAYLLNSYRPSAQAPAVLKVVNCYRNNTSLEHDLKSADWLSAAMLFSEATRNNFSFEVLNRSCLITESTGKSVQFTITKIPDTLCLSSESHVSRNRMVYAVLSELLLLHWTSLQMYKPHQVDTVESVPALIVAVLNSKNGSAVMPYLLNRGSDSSPSLCVRKAVLQFRHIAAMRILKQLPPKIFVQKFNSNLDELLNLFVEVTRIFERLSPQDCELHGLQQCPSLDEVLSFNKYVKEVIATTPASVLRTVSQELFMTCGSDVVLLVQRCLSGS